MWFGSLIVVINILRSHISHSALQSEAISLKLSNLRKNAPTGKITMKSLKGMFKKQKSVSSKAWLNLTNDASEGKAGTKTTSSEESTDSHSEDKPPQMLGRAASLGTTGLKTMSSLRDQQISEPVKDGESSGIEAV